MVKKRGWLKADITDCVRDLDWDDPSITSALFLRRPPTTDRNGLPDINAKIAAFAMQNDQPKIAGLLGIENDKSFVGALQKLRNAIRKEIESDGGGLVVYEQRMSIENYETKVEVFLHGHVEPINNGMEIIVKEDSCCTLSYYYPLHLANVRYLQASRAFAAAKVTLKPSSDEYTTLVNTMGTRKQTVTTMRRKKVEWTQNLQQGNESLIPVQQFSEMLRLRDGVSMDDYEVVVMWEYIVCMLRHQQMEDAEMLVSFYESSNWHPQLHDLEEYESFLEREARESFLESEKYDNKVRTRKGQVRTRKGHWNQRTRIMRKYKAEREQTLLNKAQRLLDPENVAVKMLQKQCQISIDKQSEYEEKTRRKARQRKRKESKAKLVEEKFGGGMFTLSELRDAAKTTLEKKTLVRW